MQRRGTDKSADGAEGSGDETAAARSGAGTSRDRPAAKRTAYYHNPAGAKASETARCFQTIQAEATEEGARTD